MTPDDSSMTYDDSYDSWWFLRLLATPGDCWRLMTFFVKNIIYSGYFHKKINYLNTVYLLWTLFFRSISFALRKNHCNKLLFFVHYLKIKLKINIVCFESQFTDGCSTKKFNYYEGFLFLRFILKLIEKEISWNKIEINQGTNYWFLTMVYSI